MGEMKSLVFNGWTDDLVAFFPDIVYSKRNGQSLILNLVQPLEFYYAQKEGFEIKKRYPVIVYAQGSGFTHPKKGKAIGRACTIARHGYIVAIVEYSNFLDGNTFLDTCKDFKTAIRFLRANADRFHIDSTRIAAWGTSSGGTNAQFAAFTGNDQRYKTDEYAEYDDSVGAAVTVAAASDLQSILLSDEPFDPQYREYWNEHPQEKDPKELCREASTIYLEIDRELPPIMLIHGTEDRIVPFRQSEMIYDKLVKKGCDVTFYKIVGGGHSNSFTSEVMDKGIEFVGKALNLKHRIPI